MQPPAGSSWRWQGSLTHIAAAGLTTFLNNQEPWVVAQAGPTFVSLNESRTSRLLKGYDMQIDKNQIIELLKSRGDHDKAAQADQELPGTVDTDKDSGLLSKFGVDPQDLLGKLPGGLGDKLGF